MLTRLRETVVRVLERGERPVPSDLWDRLPGELSRARLPVRPRAAAAASLASGIVSFTND